MNDTIAAISSAGGPIGLIRVSGERAIEAVAAVFDAKNGKSLTAAPSQKLVYGTLRDKNGKVIDCCFAVALHAPHTYTGVDHHEIAFFNSARNLRRGLLKHIRSNYFPLFRRDAEAHALTVAGFQRNLINGKRIAFSG